MEENVIQINGRRTTNVNVNVKSVMYVKKIVWNSATCICKNVNCLVSIMDDSGISCDEIIESYDKDEAAKSYDETNFNEK